MRLGIGCMRAEVWAPRCRGGPGCHRRSHRAAARLARAGLVVTTDMARLMWGRRRHQDGSVGIGWGVTGSHGASGDVFGQQCPWMGSAARWYVLLGADGVGPGSYEAVAAGQQRR